MKRRGPATKEGQDRPRRPSDFFRERLKELIPRGKATIVAQRSGVSETTLSNWKRGFGRINPELETLEKLAAAISKVTGREVAAADLIADVKKVAADAVAAELTNESSRLRAQADRLQALADERRRRS
jgi:transcriptional regulator with XRE-family HTH domain